MLGTPFCGTKIESNFRNFVTKFFAKKTRSQFCLLEQESFVLNHFLKSAAAENVKVVSEKMTFEIWTNHLLSKTNF
jgi:hypothetical protein